MTSMGALGGRWPRVGDIARTRSSVASVAFISSSRTLHTSSHEGSEQGVVMKIARGSDGKALEGRAI